MKIKELKMFTQQLMKQLEFYTKLGFKLERKSKTQFSITLGTSLLTFVSSEQATPYHFAINIPANQEVQALNWLASKTSILTNEGKKIQDFDDWNAKAIYFYDADLNIVEFIARKNLNNANDEEFGISSLLEISEIGIPCNDIQAIYNTIHQKTEMTIYDGNYDRFCAIGDEQGLFIVINKQEKDWFPSNDKAFASDFELTLEVQTKTFHAIYHHENLNIELIKS